MFTVAVVVQKALLLASLEDIEPCQRPHCVTPLSQVSSLIGSRIHSGCNNGLMVAVQLTHAWSTFASAACAFHAASEGSSYSFPSVPFG